ncbi:MAG TPA: cytochrome c3 family protein [Dissulfurispiraceae bacterium]|nr:cytochrome c3 family protein [Dissulfurispiraceae bacterium]
MRYLLLLFSAILILPAIAVADYKETFEKEFLSKPWAGEQLEEDVCIGCHSSDTMKQQYRTVVEEWKASWHAQNKISCHDCHGGDPKDATMSMSPQRGFVGVPKPGEIPEFCGKCHIAILKNYLESGHGKAFKSTGKGPNCVTCHGSHRIGKAGIDIINEQTCTKCHSYDRARGMKQALFVVEKKMGEIERDINTLREQGIFVDEKERRLFSTQADFRALFHTVDVSLVQQRTDEFTKRLGLIDKEMQDIFRELRFRKNFSAFLMLLFSGMGLVILVYSKLPKE